MVEQTVTSARAGSFMLKEYFILYLMSFALETTLNHPLCLMHTHADTRTHTHTHKHTHQNAKTYLCVHTHTHTQRSVEYLEILLLHIIQGTVYILYYIKEFSTILCYTSIQIKLVAVCFITYTCRAFLEHVLYGTLIELSNNGGFQTLIDAVRNEKEKKSRLQYTIQK